MTNAVRHLRDAPSRSTHVLVALWRRLIPAFFVRMWLQFHRSLILFFWLRDVANVKSSFARPRRSSCHGGAFMRAWPVMIQLLSCVAEWAIPDLSDRISAAERAIPDLTDRISTAERAIPDLSDRISAAERAIPDLPDRISTAERAIPDLSDRILGAMNRAGPHLGDMDRAGPNGWRCGAALMIVEGRRASELDLSLRVLAHANATGPGVINSADTWPGGNKISKEHSAELRRCCCTRPPWSTGACSVGCLFLHWRCSRSFLLGVLFFDRGRLEPAALVAFLHWK